MLYSAKLLKRVLSEALPDPVKTVLKMTGSNQLRRTRRRVQAERSHPGHEKSGLLERGRVPPEVIEHAVGSITASALTKLRYFVIVTRLLPS
jgi:hypothetical protein